MPNAKAHAGIGMAAGAFTYLGACAYYKRDVDIFELGGSALLGIAFAALPDILEPALNPNHRSTAHSVLILILAIVFLVWFCSDKNSERQEFVKIAAAVAGIGYVTHLISDSCTPKGLPICA